jgi:hypothetical protein
MLCRGGQSYGNWTCERRSPREAGGCGPFRRVRGRSAAGIAAAVVRNVGVGREDVKIRVISVGDSVGCSVGSSYMPAASSPSMFAQTDSCVMVRASDGCATADSLAAISCTLAGICPA